MKHKSLLLFQKIVTRDCGKFCSEECDFLQKRWRNRKGRTCTNVWYTVNHNSEKGPRPRDEQCIKAESDYRRYYGQLERDKDDPNA